MNDNKKEFCEINEVEYIHSILKELGIFFSAVDKTAKKRLVPNRNKELIMKILEPITVVVKGLITENLFLTGKSEDMILNDKIMVSELTYELNKSKLC